MRVGSRGGPGTSDPTSLTLENYSLANLIMSAYDVRPYQLSAPSWAATTRFLITAKLPEGTTKGTARLMLRHLLIERFGLKVHSESKEMQLYDLVVGKNGHKMKELSGEPPPIPAAAPLTAPPQFARDSEGYPVLPPGRSATVIEGSRARWQAVNETTETITLRLSGNLGRPVTNSTGLKGKYSFTLSWSPPATGVMMGALGLPVTPHPPQPGDSGVPSASVDDSGPSLFSAIQQQLGLRLESKKGMIDVLVIDHAEKVPTEN
jgi:uncharacterized protein (TIGR03435 family)